MSLHDWKPQGAAWSSHGMKPGDPDTLVADITLIDGGLVEGEIIDGAAIELFLEATDAMGRTVAEFNGGTYSSIEEAKASALEEIHKFDLYVLAEAVRVVQETHGIVPAHRRFKRLAEAYSSRYGLTLAKARDEAVAEYRRRSS